MPINKPTNAVANATANAQVDNYVIRMAPIGAKTGLLKALSHNQRTMYQDSGRYPDNIDQSKAQDNYSLHDHLSPQEIVDKTTELAREAGITKFRQNQNMGVEILFSLPVRRHSSNNSQFFQDCYDWVRGRFAGVLISFDVHLDESAPHAHAIIFPLVDGKMQGSNILGGIGNLNKYIKDFHEKVGCLHGMSKAEKLSKQCLEELDKRVMQKIGGDPVKQSVIWMPIRDAIRKNPLPFAQHLGVTYKKLKTLKKPKSFVQIMAGRGKGTTKNDKGELNKLLGEDRPSLRLLVKKGQDKT